MIKLNKRSRINFLILLISAVVWIVLLVNHGTMAIAHCPVTDSGASPVSLEMLLAMNPFSSLIIGWALMLLAMMLPTLIPPIHHVRERSFKNRRVRAVTLFLIGYFAVWIGAGIMLLALILILNLIAPQSYLPAIAVGIIAFVWQCSPVKQRSINRGHNHRSLKVFGAAADLDALNFGAIHGVWCVVSCWALMIFPMLLPQGHFVAMGVVTYLMISERIEHPKPLKWQLRFSGKLLRIAFRQAQIRLQRQSSNSNPSFSVSLDG